MSRNQTTEREASTMVFHRRAYRNFEAKSQVEKIRELVRIGILTEDRELSPRYGGRQEKPPARKR